MDDKTVKLDDNGNTLEISGEIDATINMSGEIAASVENSDTTSALRNADEEIKLSISSSVSAVPLAAAQCQDDGKLRLSLLDDLYDMGEKLGGGGQGIVYSAHDPGLLRDVAVKKLRKEVDQSPAARREFINESRLTAALDHPAIIPIYNLYTDRDGGLNLAMKKLNGISLKEYLARTNERYKNSGIASFDEESALAKRLNLLIKVCEAVAYVHSRKIIHCDLKPENIMLGEFGEVYVVDWGIARHTDEPRPADGRIVGTPRYTSPENLNGMPCSNRSDIYSLGVILFEAVTLTPAFTGSSAVEVVNKVKRGEFNELRHRYGFRIHRDLAAIIRKAIALDPGERYAAAGELTADLQAFRRGAEVSARPDTALEKVFRWANRNRLKAVAVAGALFLLLTAAGIVLFFAVNMRMAENEHLKDTVADSSLAMAVRTAVRIDRMMTHIGTMLEVLNADLALLLDLNRPASAVGNMEIIPGSLNRRQYRGAVSFIPEAGSESHFNPGDKLNLSRATYMYPEGTEKKQILHTLKCLRPVVSRMRRTILKSDQAQFKNSTGRLLTAYRRLKLPVSFCFFTLQNGLHVVFPGNDALPADYDGRKRIWYKNAKGQGAVPVWSLPYATAISGNAGVISCSMEIIGTKEKVYGVSGVDVPLKVLAEFLLETPENSICTIERLLIAPDGRIIMRSTGGKDGFKLDFVPETFSGSSAMLNEMFAKRYGRSISQEGGKEILWLYSYIPSAKWRYVEKIDLDKLMLFSQSLR